MFIDIDYSKKVTTPKYYLAKPNKQVISSIHEAMEDSLSIKLGGISELNFSIPYEVEDGFDYIENKHIKMIKEKMLIQAVIGTQKEWFVVDSIEEEGSDMESFRVNAFSLGYELSGKRIVEVSEESTNVKELLDIFLEGTAWRVSSIDAKFLNMFRPFEISSSNSLEAILQMTEEYNAIVLWNTDDRSLSIVELEGYGTYRGMSVDYGRLMQSVNVTRDSESLVTRLYVEGSDGLGIQDINPTGQNYIEDYSYFMAPFQLGANGEVLQHSDFMSDELCIALLNQKKLITQKATEIRTLINQGAVMRSEISTLEIELLQLTFDLDTIENKLEVAKSAEDTAVIDKLKTEMNAKQSEINAKKTATDKKISEYTALELKLAGVYATINRDSNFTDELIEELKYYIHEKEWTDDRYIDPQELFDEALIKFEEYKRPKIEMTTDVANFLEIIEEAYYWDKLILGDSVKVFHPRMKLEYFAKMVEVVYDFSGGTIKMTISNTRKSMNENDKLTDIIRSSDTASTILANSKYKWDLTNERMSEVERAITGEFDATKRKIVAGVNNSIEISKRGLIARSSQFPNEVVVIQSGVIALSKNNGTDWQTAITPDGIVAERLMGRIIAGQNLLITNQAGSFLFDSNGVQIDVSAFTVRSSSEGNLVDDWNRSASFTDEIQNDGVVTGFEKDIIQKEWNEMKIRYDSNLLQIANFFDETEIGELAYVTTYKQKYVALFDYLFVLKSGGLKPLLHPDDMDKTSIIDKVAYNKAFDEFIMAESTVQRELTTKVKNLADDAKNYAEDIEEKIIDITKTIGNMTSDNIVDFEERQVIKDKLTDILGIVIADTATALPTSASLDSGLKGEFYTARKSALNAGILSTDALYIDVATKYTALATYLNTMTPIKPWDLRTATEKSVITVVKETFRTTWLNYYNAINALANATSLKLKTAIDDLEKATGNLLDNPSITGVVGRWNAGVTPVIESVDFLGKTIPTLKSANTGDAQYVHSDIFVDPSKAYEVTMWLKQSAIVGSAYIGALAYNSVGTMTAIDTVDTLTGNVVSTTNAYAISGTTISPINTWVKKTFYIMPVGTDPMKMIKVGDGVANNIRMTGDTRRIRIRYLNWSNGTGTKTIWVAQPKMAEVDPNVVTGLSEVDKRVTVAEQKITNDAIVNTVVSSDRWTAQDSKFNQTAEKVAIIVTDTNKINASAIASELSITPTAMNLISQNINLAGKVTISAFDHDLKTDFDTINGWKATGKTTINGANIETGTVTATQIDTSTLIVGKNIAMGEDASISWSKVTSKPTIPTSASQIGAVANNQKAILDTLTNYGANQGLYAIDGNLYVNATYINSGTLSGVKVVSTASNGRTATLEDGGLVVYNGVYNTIVKNAGIEFSTPNYSNTTFLYMNGFSTNENFEFFTDKTIGNTIDFTNAKIKGLTSVAKFG